MIEAIIEALDVGVAVHDQQGQLIMVNSEAERLLGLTRDQMLGLDPVSPEWVICDASGQLLSAEELPVSRILKSGKALPYHVLGVTHESGTCIWLNVSGNIQYFEEDNVTRSIVVMTFYQIDHVN